MTESRSSGPEAPASSQRAQLFLMFAIPLGFVMLRLGPVGLLALLPVPIYARLALWLDRFEPEPAPLLWAAGLWGAIGAVFFSFIFNTASGALVLLVSGSPQAAQLVASVLVAPLVEEFFKGLALVGLFFFRRRDFDGIVDGVVYASMVALGFAATENLLYYGRAFSEGGEGALQTVFFLRGVLSPFSHPLFTAWTGVGLGWARESRALPVKLLAPAAGFVVAVGLHSLWNASASVNGLAWFGAYVLIMVPAGLVVLGVVLASLLREGRVVRQHLQPELDAGLLTEAEVTELASMGLRLQRSVTALFKDGRERRRDRRALYRCVGELAFVRFRVQQGRTSAEEGQAEEAPLLEQLRALLDRLG